MLPYAYWLYSKNKLLKTTSTKDTKCLYYFSPDHTELDVGREWSEDCLKGFPNKRVHVKRLKTSKWVPPPYKEFYENDVYRYSKPLCMISNKYTTEWGGPPINFLSVELLRQILDEISGRYQVIYNRPFKYITEDDQKSLEFDDFEMIRREYPDVLFLDELFKANKANDTFNEVQFKVHANCDCFLSVQGGGSVLSSYFGGTNLILAKRGAELGWKSYSNWYHTFSGAKIQHTDSDQDLFELVRTNFT